MLQPSSQITSYIAQAITATTNAALIARNDASPISARRGRSLTRTVSACAGAPDLLVEPARAGKAEEQREQEPCGAPGTVGARASCV